MTAEIAILNKGAVALAADSTVTISMEDPSGKRIKTYNSANKLFTLSKFHPVGIMIYGGAAIMGVPWETIIKQYRSKLGKKSFKTVSDYANDFKKYLERLRAVFTPELQRRIFLGTCAGYFVQVVQNPVTKEVEKLEKQGTRPTAAEIAKLTNKRISDHWKELKGKKKRLPYLPRSFEKALLRSYGKDLRTIASHVFGKTKLSSSSVRQLLQIAITITCSSTIWPDSISGVVIAGFGSEQIFPEIRTFSPHFVLKNRLIYRDDSDGDYVVSHDDSAALVPFAQQDVVDTFLQGIDSRYMKILQDAVKELSASPSGIVEKQLAITDRRKKAAILKKIRSMTTTIGESVGKKLAQYRQRVHVAPLLEIISVLPKDELASMAEALVNLTAVKRKLSPNVETVGIPIDVAVISKGDGFVWISRKHYFKPELNLQFTRNYLTEPNHGEKN